MRIGIYSGQYYDQETGLHYNYHRYYDPTIGRYLTPDPIGLAGGINVFSYSSNDPINLIDPLGLADSGMAMWGNLRPGDVPDPSILPSLGTPGAVGFGAYAFAGGEAAIQFPTCRQNEVEYKYVVITVCGGVGGGLAGKFVPSNLLSDAELSAAGVSSDPSCPRNRTYLRHDVSKGVGATGVNLNLTGGGPPASADLDLGVKGVGVTWKVCGDTVLGKEKAGNGCNNK